MQTVEFMSVHLWDTKMDSGISRAAALLLLSALLLSTPNACLGQAAAQTPDQILAAATQSSLKSKYETALKQVQSAKQQAQGDLNFSVRFISAVTSIAEMASAPTRTQLFNEALQAANEVEASKVGDGTTDAQFAWNYMVALEKLADGLVGTSSETSSKLYRSQANVAANLAKNPSYPQQSLALLGHHMMGEAYANAHLKDEAKTIASINVALAAGYTDFEMLMEHEFITGFNSAPLKTLIETKLAAYKKELQVWARNSISNFQSFQFKFDVADIDAGRIRNSDYQGRILVLDLWATWCQPCREAIPHFVKLEEKFRNDNVDVVGISMDNPDNPVRSLKVVRKFVDDNGVEYAVAMGNKSVLNQLAPGQKLPTVLFIDTEGQVRYIAEGPHNFCQLSAITDELVQRVEELQSPTSEPSQNDRVW